MLGDKELSSANATLSRLGVSTICPLATTPIVVHTVMESPTRTTHFYVSFIDAPTQPATEQGSQQRPNGFDLTLRKPQLMRSHENTHNPSSTYLSTPSRTPTRGATLHQGLANTEAPTGCLTSRSSLPLGQGAETYPQKSKTKPPQ